MSTSDQHPTTDPVLEITKSILTEAAQRPWLAALLLRRQPMWLTRLAQLAQRIRNLPRHTRRALRRKLAAGLASAALLLALANPSPAYAASITVNGDGTGGTCSLANAITSANTDTATGNCPAGSGADTINLTVDVGLTSALPDITSAITIEGNNHTISRTSGTLCILKVVSGGNLTLNTATISGGSISGKGGGISNNGGTVTVNNSTLSGNSATHSGGGIYNNGTLTVNNSTLSGNSATLYGGGLFNKGMLTVNNSTVSSNSANYGGGIFNSSGSTLMLNNSTLSGNSATHSGGGIYNNFGTLTVNNSTLSGNSATSGGGIYNYSGTVNVKNSIVALQTSGGDCMNSITSQGYNIDSDSSCGFTGTGDQQGVSSGSLNLGALANNGSSPHPFTRALGSGSVAIDQIPIGTNGCVAGTSTDERGAARADGVNKGGSACDVGAYEVSTQTPTAIALRDFAATSVADNSLPGLLGAMFAALAGLGAWAIGRRRKEKAQA